MIPICIQDGVAYDQVNVAACERGEQAYSFPPYVLYAGGVYAQRLCREMHQEFNGDTVLLQRDGGQVDRAYECAGEGDGRMTTDAAHTRWWQIFEVVVGVPLLAAIALHLMLPLTFPRGRLAPVIGAGGVALVMVGLVIVILARRALAQRGQPTDPGRPTSRLVTSGVFSVSRNPLYLGGVCVLVGMSLVVNLLWIVVLLLPTIVACHYLLIAPEERYLAMKFGTEYQTYAASVHRWIGRTRHEAQQ